MEEFYDLKKLMAMKDETFSWKTVYHEQARKEKDIEMYEIRLVQMEEYIDYLEQKVKELEEK